MKIPHTLNFYFFFVGILCATLPIYGQGSCTPIYVTTTGASSALGSMSMPTNLGEAIFRLSTTGGTIRMATGTYIINQALEVPNYVTLEGGFDPMSNWSKISSAGATTIYRTALNPEGIYNTNQHLTALELVASEGVRLQDLTIETVPGGPGVSTYGIFIDNASDYSITRVQVLAGDAGNGVEGMPGCGRLGAIGSSLRDGSNGMNGENGEIDDNNANIKGGTGGAGGIACNNFVAAIGGLGGTANNGNVGQDGDSAIAGSLDGGGGAGGGQGGPEADGFQGGTSGAGGAPLVPPSGCATTLTGLGSTTIGGIGGLLDDPGTAGVDGIDGVDGNAGCQGSQGSQGSIQSCRFYVGGQGGIGTDGSAGSGGSGGGGGGGQNCTFCVDGTGNAGGGGGGGGAGGQAGTGSYGGGASFGIFICNNGNNGRIEDCWIEAGAFGLGGVGGQGGAGGIGGQGGLGGAVGTNEIGQGGNGGAGGNGGNGGQGGNGSDGIARNIYWSGTGISPVSMDSTFDLAAQPNIRVNAGTVIGQPVVFTDLSLPTGTGITNWDFDLESNWATPSSATDNPSSTIYTIAGRYSIRHNTIGGSLSVYKGFFDIPVGFTIGSTTTAATSTTLGDGTATVSVPSIGGPYTYQWDSNANNQTTAMATGLIPGIYCVTIAAANSCRNATCATVLLNTSTSIVQEQESEIQLYPNPANDRCFLIIKGKSKVQELRIVNSLGQVVHQIKPNRSKFNLNTSHLGSGVYWIELSTLTGQKMLKKLLVQH